MLRLSAVCLSVLALTLPVSGDDEPTLEWEATFSQVQDARANSRDVAFGGTRAFAIGELAFGGGVSEQRSTYVRGWDRAAGTELWRVDFDEETALAIATDATGSLVYALMRDVPPEHGVDGVQRLVLLDGADGSQLFEKVEVLDSTGAFSASYVEDFGLSPSGLTLYRLEFSRFGGQMRVIAEETQTGAERWSVTAPGWWGMENTSLEVAPDSASLYVAFTPDAPSAQYPRMTMRRMAALDGAELWSKTFAEPNRSLRGIRPMPSPDGLRLYAAYTYGGFGPETVAFSLDSADGAELASIRVPMLSFGSTFDPVNERLAACGWSGFVSQPDGIDLQVEMIDLATASSAWSEVYVGLLESDRVESARFSDDGDELYVLEERTETTSGFGYTVGFSIRAIDAASSLENWRSSLPVLPSDFSYTEHSWIDAYSVGGATSLVAAGFSNADPTEPLYRDGFRASDGVALWSFGTSDVLPGTATPVGRAWLSRDEQALWVWPLEVGPYFDALGLRLEKRDVTDGSVLEVITIPEDALGSFEFDLSFSPYSDWAAVEVPISGTFDSKLLMVDLSGGGDHHEILVPIPNSRDSWSFAWSPDGTRLFTLDRANAEVVAYDLVNRTHLWSRFVASSGPLGFTYTIAEGLAVDPTTNDPLVALATQTIFPPAPSTLEKMRLSATDGTTLWTESVPSVDFEVDEHTFIAKNELGRSYRFGRARQLLNVSSATGETVSVLLFNGGAGKHVVLFGLDTDVGQTHWVRFSAMPFVETFDFEDRARIVDTEWSADGSLLHVLADGIDANDASAGRRSLVLTFDMATLTVLWERFVDAQAVERGRRILSLGDGARIAVATSDFADTEPGGLRSVVVLDAATGIELTRINQADDREVCDIAYGTDGSLFVVGSKETSGNTVGFIRRLVLPSLIDGDEPIAVNSGGSYPLHIDRSPVDANDAYLLLGSASGTSPTTSFMGLDIPLVVDSYLISTLAQANQGVYVNTFGLLDAHGDARASIEVPAGVLSPSLAGITLSFAALVYDTTTGTYSAVTEAVAVTLAP